MGDWEEEEATSASVEGGRKGMMRGLTFFCFLFIIIYELPPIYLASEQSISPRKNPKSTSPAQGPTRSLPRRIEQRGGGDGGG